MTRSKLPTVVNAGNPDEDRENTPRASTDQTAGDGGLHADQQWPNVVLVLGQEDQVRQILTGLLPRDAEGAYKIVFRNGVALALRQRGGMLPLCLSSAKEDVILLGHLVHEMVPAELALSEALATLSSGKFAALSRLQGIFALIRVNWEQGKVQVVSDLLGIKPFYTCRHQQTVVLSDRAETCAHWNGPRIDPIGFAAYIMLNTALGQRCLYEGVGRVQPGCVMSITAEETRAETFWTPPVDDLSIGTEELAESFHHEFRQSVDRLLAPHDQATILLSGGFDSRLNLLTALALKRIELDCVTVATNDADDRIAACVAAEHGTPYRCVTIKGSLWDEFPGLWHRHPDGYPIRRNLTYLAVTSTHFTGPYVDGSMEGAVFRCPMALPADHPPATMAEAYQHIWSSRQSAPELIFRPEPLRRHVDAAQAAMREQGELIGWQPKFRVLWHISTHDRRYVSNNFLQYENLRTSVQPFYDRALLERRLRYQDRAFSKDAYRQLLERYFPRPGGHPHASDLPQGRDTSRVFCRSLWRQIPSLIAFVERHRNVFNHRWLLPRLSSYFLGRSSQLYVVMSVARLRELELMIGREQAAAALSAEIE
jgi:hypothetical protein